jgi:hypothetical protein
MMIYDFTSMEHTAYSAACSYHSPIHAHPIGFEHFTDTCSVSAVGCQVLPIDSEYLDVGGGMVGDH